MCGPSINLCHLIKWSFLYKKFKYLIESTTEPPNEKWLWIFSPSELFFEHLNWKFFCLHGYKRNNKRALDDGSPTTRWLVE